MVKEAKGTLFKRKDGKMLIYLPKGLSGDSLFPFTNFGPGKRSPAVQAMSVKVSFEPYHPGRSPGRIIIEPWRES